MIDPDYQPEEPVGLALADQKTPGADHTEDQTCPHHTPHPAVMRDIAAGYWGREFQGEKMIHEIINPSDPYTIECDDMAVLTAAIFFLGKGAYGTVSKDTDFNVPTTIFGENGADFFVETFGERLDKYIETHKQKIAECLDTVVIGTVADRDIYLLAIGEIKGEHEKEVFAKKWYEEKRTSMNEIGQRAYAIAQILREGE